MLLSKVLERIPLSYLSIVISSCTKTQKLKNNLLKLFQHLFDFIANFFLQFHLKPKILYVCMYVCIYLSIYLLIYSSPEDIFSLLRERQRENNIYVKEKHRPVASLMCLYQRENQQPRYGC